MTTPATAENNWGDYYEDGAYEMEDDYDNYAASNSDSDGSSSYEWVYYDVEECKSCDSSDENDMYANDMNTGDYEYYDEVSASASEN